MIPHLPEDDVDALVSEPVGRDVGGVLLRYGAGSSLLALVAAAALFRSWTVFVIGLIFAVAFMLLITAPLWLALSTEVADRTKARESGLEREGLRKP
jgi:hypothetical protein